MRRKTDGKEGDKEGKSVTMTKQVIVVWFTPEERLPKEDYITVVTFSGKDRSVSYDHALGLATWADDGCGWIIEGLSDDAEYEIHAWCDLDPYR